MDDAAEDRKLENISQPGKPGHHREEGLQNGLIPPRQTNGYPEQPRQQQRHHVSAMEQMVVNWHQLNGEMQRNGELPSWSGPQESRDTERRPTPKRSANGLNSCDRRPDGRTMKRRTPSEGDEGMTPGMWQQFTQQAQAGGRPWGASRGQEDGMERYFNDNAHLLQHLDNNPNIPNGVGNDDEGFDRAVVNSDESEDDAFVNENEEDVMQVVMAKTHSMSSEDLGDFIETDISLPNHGSSSYANSLNSSTEDLVRVDSCGNRREGNKENVPENDRRRPVSLFTPSQHNSFPANITYLPSQKSKSEGPGSALNSDSSSSNYFSPEGDIEDFDMESNPSHVDPDSVRNSTECLHDKGNNNGNIGAACNQAECSKHWKLTEKNVCAVKLIKDSQTCQDELEACNMEVAMLDLGLHDSRSRDDVCDDESGAAGGEPACVNNLDYDRARVANLTTRQPYNLSRHTSTSNCETDENSTQDDMELNQLSSPNSENNDSDVYESFVSNVKADSFAHFRECLESGAATSSRTKTPAKMWSERTGFYRQFGAREPGLNIGAHSHANLTSQSSTSDDDSPGLPVKPPQFSDDDSPSTALRLLDYEFLDAGNNHPAWTRHQHNTDDSSPDAENCASCQKSSTLKRHEKDVELKARNVGQGHDLVAAAAELNVDITGIPGLDRSMINMLAGEGRSLQDRLIEHCSHSGDHRRAPADEDKAMIWCEYQAFLLQVKQIGASACGATAIINVLKAFDMYEDPERVMEVVQTNLRAEDAPVPEYLLSRSVAGTTAENLIEGIAELTGGAICGRFFPTWPVKNFNLSKWLCKWIRKGAVPLLTLNLQRGGPMPWVNGVTDNIRSDSRTWQKVRDRVNEVLIPDAWHHQMCYGVGPKGIYLTNPLEVVPPSHLWEQLCSDSELLIRRQDIVSRWHQDTDLSILLSHEDPRWRTLNVLGQVVNVIREEAMRTFPGCQPPVTSHIRIPAWYKAGITLYVRRGSPVHEELMAECGLPDLVESPQPGQNGLIGGLKICNSDLSDISDGEGDVSANVAENTVASIDEMSTVQMNDSQSSAEDSSTCPHHSNISNHATQTVAPQNVSMCRYCLSREAQTSSFICLNGDLQNPTFLRNCVQSGIGGNGSRRTRGSNVNEFADRNPMEGTSNSNLNLVYYYDTGQYPVLETLGTDNDSGLETLSNCDGPQRNLHNSENRDSQNSRTVAMETNGVSMDTDNASANRDSSASNHGANESVQSNLDGASTSSNGNHGNRSSDPWFSRP